MWGVNVTPVRKIRGIDIVPKTQTNPGKEPKVKKLGCPTRPVQPVTLE